MFGFAIFVHIMLKDFKPTLIILARFLIIYLVLLAGYQFYLNYFKDDLDPFSKWVAGQSCDIQSFSGYPSVSVDDPKHQTAWFYVSKKYVARMVEGCNAISVMILFLAFVFAFYKGFKTFIFAIIGLVILHVSNVLRIAALNMVHIEWPQYSKITHDYAFPAVIYGSVVLLWLIWIKYFALKNETR